MQQDRQRQQIRWLDSLAIVHIRNDFYDRFNISCSTTTRPRSKQRTWRKGCYWRQSQTLVPRRSNFYQSEDEEHAKTALDRRVKDRSAKEAHGRCCRRCQQCLCFLGHSYIA